MIAELYTPSSISPFRLDRYLAGGWFRCCDFLFRNSFICFDGKVSSIVNIRLKVSDYKKKKSHRRVLNRVNKKFKCIIRPAVYSDDKQRLYELTKPRFAGFVLPHLKNLIFGFERKPLYKTYEICVFDGDKLIAISFFDTGNNSIASISALHDPEYSKYGLGNYTLYKEIEYAVKNDYKFYYPGYILDNNPVFNYKLSIGPMQYRSTTKRWVKLQNNNVTECNETIKYYDSIKKITSLLEEEDINYRKFLNPYYTLGYVDMISISFIKSIMPVIIDVPRNNLDKIMIEYDFDTDSYQISMITRTLLFDYLKNVQDATYFEYNNNYLTNLYIYKDVMYSGQDLNLILENLHLLQSTS